MPKYYSFLLLFLPFGAVSQQNPGHYFLKTWQWEKAEAYFLQQKNPAPPQVTIREEAVPVFLLELPAPERPQFSNRSPFPDQKDADNMALVKGNPRHARAHFDLGMRYWSLAGQDSLAEYHLRQAVASRSEYPEARQALGRLLQLQNRFGEAEIHLRRNLERYPDSPFCYEDLAGLYFHWQRQAKLEETWRAELKTFPKNLNALRNLDYLLVEQGRYVEAERLLLDFQFSQNDPENGLLLLEEHYQRCIASWPDSVRFHRALGELYYGQVFEEGNGEKRLARLSLKYLQAALAKKTAQPGLGHLNFQIGRLQLFLENPNAAIPHLEKAVEGMEEKTDPLFYLIDAYMGADRSADALRLLEPLAAKPGLDYRRDVLLARLLALDGRLDEALYLADSIIAYFPNSRTPETYRIRAYVLEQKGDLTGAIEALRVGIFFDYASATDYYQIAKLYFRQEPWREGLIWLDGALVKGLPRVILRNDPELDRFREEADFREVLSHYNL